MRKEYHRWYSQRMGFELGVIVYGHWGQPMLGFPTSAGDEHELENMGLIGALSEDSGPVLLVVAVGVLGCVLSYLWGRPADVAVTPHSPDMTHAERSRARTLSAGRAR